MHSVETVSEVSTEQYERYTWRIAQYNLLKPAGQKWKMGKNEYLKRTFCGRFVSEICLNTHMSKVLQTKKRRVKGENRDICKTKNMIKR